MERLMKTLLIVLSAVSLITLNAYGMKRKNPENSPQAQKLAKTESESDFSVWSDELPAELKYYILQLLVQDSISRAKNA